jgi:hypothetical protein
MSAHDPSSAELMWLLADSPWDPLALDEDTAERLLAGELDPSEAPPGFAEVAAIMAAAAAAPNPDELAGEPAAVARLLAARSRQQSSRRRRTATTRGRRRIGLAVAIIIGALSMGGVAAAATGHLPEPIREAARSLLTTIGVATPGTPAGSDRQPVPSTEGPGAGTTPNHGQGTPRTRAAHDKPPLRAPTTARAAMGVGRGTPAPGVGGRAEQADRRGAARHADGRGCGADRIAASCGAAPPSIEHRAHGQGEPKRTHDGGSKATGHGQGRGHGEPPPGTANQARARAGPRGPRRQGACGHEGRPRPGQVWPSGSISLSRRSTSASR